MQNHIGPYVRNVRFVVVLGLGSYSVRSEQLVYFKVAILANKGWKIQTLLLLSERSQILAIEWRHCECCTSWSWPTFRGHEFWNVNISKSVRASEKCSSMTFIRLIVAIESDHCERCTPWPWPSFSRSNIFLLCIGYKKMHTLLMTPGRFASTRTVFVMKLPLFLYLCSLTLDVSFPDEMFNYVISEAAYYYERTYMWSVWSEMYSFFFTVKL